MAMRKRLNVTFIRTVPVLFHALYSINLQRHIKSDVNNFSAGESCTKHTGYKIICNACCSVGFELQISFQVLTILRIFFLEQLLFTNNNRALFLLRVDLDAQWVVQCRFKGLPKQILKYPIGP
jgi:hypothetical protein